MAKTCSKYFFFHTRSCIALLHWYIQHRFPYPHSCPSMLHSQPGSYSLLMLRLLLTSVRRGRWWPLLQPSPSSKNSNRVINSNKVIEKLSVSSLSLNPKGLLLLPLNITLTSSITFQPDSPIFHAALFVFVDLWQRSTYWAVKWQARGSAKSYIRKGEDVC